MNFVFVLLVVAIIAYALAQMLFSLSGFLGLFIIITTLIISRGK